MSNYSANKFTISGANESWSKIFDLVPERAKVLDVGCSSGNLGAVLISDKWCEVTGIDIDANDVALAKKRLTKAFVKNIEADSIEALGKFDCVIFADVIEHLRDPAAALDKVRKNLKKDGILIFSIPNMAHISVRLMLMGGYFEYTETGLVDKTHLHFYDENEVAGVLAAGGFEIIKLDPTIRDFPDFAIEEELKKLGLHASPAFYKQVLKSQGMIYQFVGTARARGSKTPALKKRPLVYTRTNDQLTRNVESVQQKSADHIRNLEAMVAGLNEQLSYMRQPAIIKLNHKLKRKLGQSKRLDK